MTSTGRPLANEPRTLDTRTMNTTSADKLPFAPVPMLNQAAMEEARSRWDNRAKPQGALGRVEDLAVHLAGVTGSCPPPVPKRPAVVVFAADHGVVADGASAWPSEITAAMVHTISAGGAAVSAFARIIGASVTVVDVGVASALGALPGVRCLRVRSGTHSIVHGPAMTAEEAAEAVRIGATTAGGLIDDGVDCLIGGEMGIGNTTPAAAIIGTITGSTSAAVTGLGAGLPSRGLEHKRRLVNDAIRRATGEHAPHTRSTNSEDIRRPGPQEVISPMSAATPRSSPTQADLADDPSGDSTGDQIELLADPIELLAQLGGLEIASLAGFYAAAASRSTPFIVDGVIACAALCAADLLAPGTASHAIAGHRSSEPAASAALNHVGLLPLLELDLRLGEGTGACLAFPLVAAAAEALTGMAGLPEA